MVGEELILNEGKLKRAFKDIRERRGFRGRYNICKKLRLMR